MKNNHYSVEYTDDKVSAWGGFSVMQQFTKKMQLREFIKTLTIPQMRPEATGKKLKLFDDKEFYEQYRYHCFYTNQTSLPNKSGKNTKAEETAKTESKN